VELTHIEEQHIIFTNHAFGRMSVREITIEMVRAALANPIRTGTGYKSRLLAYKSSGMRIFKVVCTYILRKMKGSLLSLWFGIKGGEMQITYDTRAEAMYIKFCDGEFVANKEVEAGIIIDMGKGNIILGIEVLEASSRFRPEDLARVDIQMPLSLATSG